MKYFFLSLISFYLLNLFSCSLNSNDEIHFPLLMPDVQPLERDIYLCTAFRMPFNTHRYIVEFIPNATMATAHHILIYGCTVPGLYQRDTPRGVWDCGEMHNAKNNFAKQPPCARGNEIIYAWAMDAPRLVLPEGVGFKVGGDTGINFLVLQVHYANIQRFLEGNTDHSGVFLSMVDGDSRRVNKRAGILLLGTGGSIPANSYEHMETTCMIDEDITLHPFAFRTHTHKLGKVVSGWLIKSGNWSLIGHHNPQNPQMFYPAENKFSIKAGDVIAARCTMDNYQDHLVAIGRTGDDEMCNFYLMYYVDGDQILSNKFCFSPGPPYYYWTSDPLLNYHVPKAVDKQASQL